MMNRALFRAAAKNLQQQQVRRFGGEAPKQIEQETQFVVDRLTTSAQRQHAIWVNCQNIYAPVATNRFNAGPILIAPAWAGLLYAVQQAVVVSFKD
eukprot:UN01927